MDDFNAIPVIDIRALAGGDDAALALAVDAITEACERVGFLYVTGHGVPEETVAGVFEAARRFFALPQDRRDAIDVARSPCFRGYVPMGTVGPGVPPRLLEAFQMMLDLGPHDPDVRAGSIMHGPNQWPAGAPGFRQALTSYHDAMMALCHRLLGGFARGLGVDPDFFRPFFRKPLTQLRLLHYPPQPPETAGRHLGVEAHTDPGVITILLQDGTGGLEVRNRAGQWLPATPLPGAFVVNIGDMMMRWTNGRFVSTPHRVGNRGGAGRISVPFFANPDYSAVVSPLPVCIPPGEAPRYSPLACGPYVETAYRAAWPRAEAA